MIVDTDILVEMLRTAPDHRIERWMNAQPIAPSTTAVTLSEILAGAGLLESYCRRTTLQQLIRRITEEDFAYQILPFDTEAARAYGEMVERIRPGPGFHVADLQVAAIVHSRNGRLATRQTETFKNPGVDVDNPFARTQLTA